MNYGHLLLIAIAAHWSPLVFAEDYPDRPVKIIVPYPVGEPATSRLVWSPSA